VKEVQGGGGGDDDEVEPEPVPIESMRAFMYAHNITERDYKVKGKAIPVTGHEGP
jgi:hypothetical protein